jgi:hypothetical protein
MTSNLSSKTIHQTIQPSSERESSNVMLFGFMRTFIVCIIIIFLNAAFDISTSILLLCASSAIGIFTACFLYKKQLRTRGFLTILIVLWILYMFITSGLTLLYTMIFSNGIPFFVFLEHFEACALALGINSFLTWFVLHSSRYVTFEILGALFAAVYAFSGHRGFKLDNPKIINTISWYLGTSQITTLVFLGASLTISVLVYLYLISFSTHQKNNQFSLKFAGFTAFVALLFFFCIYISGSLLGGMFQKEAGSRLSNGVGMEQKEGLSPLSFHSALGGTNQPAALIRLEKDYKGNPFSPMMYLREGALSELTANEIVQAEERFDTDTPKVAPAEHYDFSSSNAPHLKNSNGRFEILQKVYLLTDHKTDFALDYPISLTPLKAPDSRFKSAYQAISVAPTYKLSDIATLAVGDPSWSSEFFDHYTRTSKNENYKLLAFDITKGSTFPVESAFKIAKYLSEQSIYTLTPNHTLKEGEDPVVPYLFGDKRGYCVHFAHATVYMLRALKIPARIGLGYLTDFSQAKDGHILLRMSDRHAWAEVYIQNIGWVPFDTQPEKVESHADTKVDANMLEELMGLLQPNDEVLKPENFKDEKGLEVSTGLTFKSLKPLLYVLLILFLLFNILKLIIRFGWRIFQNPQKKLRYAYYALLSKLYDAGFIRETGETRLEYFSRTYSALKTISKVRQSESVPVISAPDSSNPIGQNIHNTIVYHSDFTFPSTSAEHYSGQIPDTLTCKESFQLVHPIIYTIYAPLSPSLSIETLQKSIKDDFLHYRNFPLWKRIIAWFNPRSLFMFFRKEL